MSVTQLCIKQRKANLMPKCCLCADCLLFAWFLCIRNGPEWWRLRSEFQQGLSRPQSVRLYLPQIDQVIQEFINYINSWTQSVGKYQDFLDELSRLYLECKYISVSDVFLIKKKEVLSNVMECNVMYETAMCDHCHNTHTHVRAHLPSPHPSNPCIHADMHLSISFHYSCWKSIKCRWLDGPFIPFGYGGKDKNHYSCPYKDINTNCPAHRQTVLAEASHNIDLISTLHKY